MTRPKHNATGNLDCIMVGLARLWLVLACLAPDLSLFGPFKVRPEDIAAVLMAGLVGARILLSGTLRRASAALPGAILFFTFSLGLLGYIAVLASLASDSLPQLGTFGFNIESEILKEYVRYGKYFIIATVFSTLPARAWRPLLSTFFFCCLVIVGIQILQYMAFPSILDFVNTTYQAGLVAELTGPGARTAGYWKSGSVMVQPNVLGAFLVVPMILSMMLYIRDLGNDRSGLFWMTISALLVPGLFMTQSMTAAFAVALGGIVSFAFVPQKRKVWCRMVGLTAVLIAVIIFAHSSGGMTKFTRAGIERGFGVGSLGKKISNIDKSIEQLGPRIIIGGGPGTGLMADSEIGYILIWYGVLGLGTYYFFYFMIYRLAVVRIHDGYIRAAFIGMLFAFMFGAVGATFLINNRVFPVFLALLAVAVNAHPGPEGSDAHERVFRRTCHLPG